ncbi:hypothetical protein HMPREF0536_11978 [Limosilactobacillus reuteri MM4-1A]|uniref:Uncharacterized protein n=1 Tax=Limosilactobacillus reuteri MM4-1A TaxID=548485 RepID=A0A828RK45_LIMRT|nr:hypothetical protein HMPREF0535_1272 [Limosilactobacillus reuteri MM2-3]EGC14841.1 hypothetical protein HMPREF0536_11978 [Limosilactobacillus reuteri MM4-1A]
MFLQIAILWLITYATEYISSEIILQDCIEKNSIISQVIIKGPQSKLAIPLFALFD